MGYREEFIEFMVESDVLAFGDFITKSGRRSPYFINTGNYESASQIDRLGKYYAACISQHMDEGHIDRDVNVIFGPAYKGIPLAVSTGIAMLNEYDKNLQYCFNRKEIKDHGEGGNLIGHKISKGDKVIVIDDVITAGTAIKETLSMIDKIGDVTVEALIVSVDRMEMAKAGEAGRDPGKSERASSMIEREYGVRVFSVTNIRQVINHLSKYPINGKLYIDEKAKQEMETYLKAYSAE